MIVMIIVMMDDDYDSDGDTGGLDYRDGQHESCVNVRVREYMCVCVLPLREKSCHRAP
jgi:hypothetical protein